MHVCNNYTVVQKLNLELVFHVFPEEIKRYHTLLVAYLGNKKLC